MPVSVSFDDKDGKTKLLFTVKVLGKEGEPWNPVRAELNVRAVAEGGKVKAFKMESGGLEPLLLDDGVRLVVKSDSAPKPQVSPLYEKKGGMSFGRPMPSHVAFVTTLNERTGIYTYTRHLADALGRVFPVKVWGAVPEIGRSALLHLQHEFGIFPYVDELVGERVRNVYRVATLHTVYDDPQGEILRQYYELDKAYDVLVVHTDLAKKFLKQYVKGDVKVIPHGSAIFEPMEKKAARYLLKLAQDAKVVFSFGFASDSKGFQETLAAAKKMPNVTFVFSAAIHGVAEVFSEDALASMRATKLPNVRILAEFLSEEDVDVWASAADVLLYNYYTPGFIASASGALHRLLAAGKPVVATRDDARLVELEDGLNSVRYDKGDVDGLVYALSFVLTDADLAQKLGENARKLAERTSWDAVARKHFALYGELVGEAFGGNWYDEEYYVGQGGGKEYFDAGGASKHWSYFNADGEWEGARPIMEAIKAVLKPQTMLSIGEGRGTFVAYARDVGIDARGLDFSVWAVGNPYPRAAGHLYLGDARDLSEYEDGSFDVVFASDIMEHIYVDDLDKAISEVQRVSKRWVFYNNGGLTRDDEKPMILKKGELPTKEQMGSSLAGHVTVQHCAWWKEKLVNDRWRLREDLVAEFRKRVNAVSPQILTNWACVVVTEKVADA